jgi:hypothetical protein
MIPEAIGRVSDFVMKSMTKLRPPNCERFEEHLLCYDPAKKRDLGDLVSARIPTVAAQCV